MHLEHRVAIIGGGLAGLRAAIAVHDRGVKDVAIISQLPPVRSHSVAAAGGINGSLANHPNGKDDSWERHMFDTVKGSDFLADQDAAEVMAREAVPRIIEMEHWGCPFSRNEDGTIAQRPFGGAGFPRTAFAADKTGHALLHTMYQQTLKRGIKVYSEVQVLELAVEDGRVVGAVIIDILSGTVGTVKADAFLFATGGAGKIYAHSTNNLLNTGLGMAVAFHAGVPLKDMEFIQFHPTGLWGTNILMTEGCRGEGAILRNVNGERFMERYAPTLKDLAPRDFVSRCMDQEIKEGRGCGPQKDYIHLDMTHLGGETILKRLPSVFEIGHNFANVDITKEPIPVVPTIHYQMGGIPTNIHGQVVVPNGGDPNAVVGGLYAVGECSCVSVHGANRLGTNSLLDLLVFGRAAGNHIVDAFKRADRAHKPLPQDAADLTLSRLARLDASSSGEYAQDVANDLRATMQQHAGVFSTQASMDEGVVKVAALRERVEAITLKDKSQVFNTARVEALEVENLIESAQATMVSAAARRECRGAHTVKDYERGPDDAESPLGRNDREWMKHTLWYAEGSRLEYKPVQMKPLTVESVPPKVRTF